MQRILDGMCSKLIINTSEGRHWRRSGVFIVNFELTKYNIQQSIAVFLQKTSNRFWSIKIA